jgi:hypothetical protein
MSGAVELGRGVADRKAQQRQGSYSFASVGNGRLAAATWKWEEDQPLSLEGPCGSCIDQGWSQGPGQMGSASTLVGIVAACSLGFDSAASLEDKIVWEGGVCSGTWVRRSSCCDCMVSAERWLNLFLPAIV